MADDNLFTLELVTPERVLFAGPVAEVVVRTAEGDATFLAGHTPLVGTVEPGVVRLVLPDGTETRFAVHGGFVQVEQHVPAAGLAEPASAATGTSSTAAEGSRVTLLAGIAELDDEIDVARAQAAQDAATALVAELGGSTGRTTSSSSSSGTGSEGAPEVDVELVEAEAALRRAQVRLEAAGMAAGASSHA